MTGLRPALRPALPPSFPASSPQSRQEIRATDAGLMCSCAYKNLGFGRDFALSECSYDGDIQMIDSSSIRVHQHAANAQKR
jgi:hypothetical protein